jgi:adenylate cyclase
MEARAERGRDLVSEAGRRLQRIGMLANTAGALDTFVFVLVLLPPLIESDNQTLFIVINSVVFCVYLPLTLVLGTRTTRRQVAPLREWLGRRPPTAAERNQALRVARDQAMLAARFWVIAALLFASINAVQSPAGAAVVLVTLLLGGVTTSSINYLAAERALRPIATEALSHSPPAAPAGPGVAARISMVWVVSTGVSLLGIAAISVAGLVGDGMDAESIASGTFFLAVFAALAGVLGTSLVARSLGDSLAAMRSALARVEEGDYDVQVSVDDASEVGHLQSGFNRMAAGLAERERLRDLFGRHVGRDVAVSALDSGVKLGGEVREVGVLVVDLVGSTSMAARMAPDRVVALLNDFFAIVVQVVESHGGFVNKFEGDGALCVFGAPAPLKDPAGAALAAGRELCARLADELPDAQAGVGISAGPSVAGNVGAEERFEYTVIGDPVNEAARLSELAKRRPEGLAASGTAVELATQPERARWEIGEDVQLRGRDEPTRLAVASSIARRADETARFEEQRR